MKLKSLTGFENKKQGSAEYSIRQGARHQQSPVKSLANEQITIPAADP